MVRPILATNGLAHGAVADFGAQTVNTSQKLMRIRMFINLVTRH